MEKLRKSKFGFTLIEVLIVVVILGILAALILPRLLQQPEKAVVAEGAQFLGVIRRALLAFADSAGQGAFPAPLPVSGAPGAGAQNAGWTAIGLQPIPATSRFTYACAGAVGTIACTATRGNIPAGTPFNDSTITMSVDAPATEGTFIGCGGTAPNNYILTNGQCVPA